MEKYAIPEGTRDLILGECNAKKALQKRIETVFDAYGYDEVITPSIEYYRTYSQGFVSLKEEEMYKFFDHNNAILTLRMDMTVPIARMAATKFKHHKSPLRFRYCANVYKVKQYFAGKRNEVSDCGIELLGQSAKESDLEILMCAMEVMEQLSDKPFTLELGDVRFFHEACREARLSSTEMNTLADLIDRKSLTELSTYVNQLRLTEAEKQFFEQLPWFCGDVEVLQEAKQYCFNDTLKNILNDLQKYYDGLCELGFGSHVTFDLGKLPHLNYYSGLLFEGFVEGIGTSVLSGGRYDSLLAKFGNDMPAIGFSVKLDYVLDVLEQKNEPKTILYYPANLKIEALKQAKELRKSKRVALCQSEDYNEITCKEENL